QGGGTQLHNIVTDQAGTARELCSEEGDVHWRGEQGLWGAHREERRPIPLRRYLGDAANEEVYCELRYQGQLYDAETGLYYNRHRYYDAESGQYLSPDPIGLLGGIRPQAYVHNPLEWVDPFGLDKKGPHGNSKNSQKAQHGYEIIDNDTGNVVKTGVSQSKLKVGPNGELSSPRANTQVRKWNKEVGRNELGKEKYSARVVHQEPAGPGARKRILEWELKNADKHRQTLDPIRHKTP
ncbi:RHS repeat-associated core domain-containing protein, partial [Pectobacterium parmentieri]|uniref:RHS repeat-associated core domain-containing protein n=1 Tax=Pectobacterium parmentieri TaxID=1905730 RepID=UPI00301AD2ED